MNEEHQLELSIQQAISNVKRRDALIQLQASPHWKILIDSTYLESEPVRLVMLKADPAVQTEKLQKAIDDDIAAIGNFYQFLSKIIYLGDASETSIQDDKETLVEIRRESIEDIDSIDELGQ